MGFSSRMIPTLTVCLLLALLSSGCGGAASSPTPGNSAGENLNVTSPAFKDGEEIPVQYTCDGEDISPPLVWSASTEGAESFAVIVEDPDAPGEVFTHWVLYNLSADRFRIIENERAGVQGANDFLGLGYGGPCPPEGESHRYIFRVFALDSTLSLGPGVSVEVLREAMDGHILAQGELVGRFSR